MKKIFLTIFLLFFNLNTFAINESCFEYKGEVEVPKNEVFLLNTDKEISYAKNENTDIYLKFYKSSINNLDFKSNISSNELNYIKDGNNDTFYTHTLGGNNDEFVIDFGKQVGIGVSSKIVIDSINYNYKILISDDNINYIEVLSDNLDTFSFRYLKFKFYSNNKDIVENIKIRELNFEKQNYSYLVKSENSGKIKLFSNFFCSNSVDAISLKEYRSRNNEFVKTYSFNSKIKNIDLNLSKNLLYKPNILTDIDGDSVSDDKDNCKNDYNPNQLDTNSNGKGDICDDDDIDGIIGKNDNCMFIYNPDQKDVNNNTIGDVCEFDKDKDGIFDSLDNCINNKNSGQEDDDKDNVGNVCDNCKLYNPTQLDKNNNSIGDECEENLKFRMDNDYDKDGILNENDNCLDKKNPGQEDDDKDNVGNVCDNCKDIKNFEQIDLNENSIGDMCEDSDKDGFLGYLDNCINDSNPDQKDSDNNSIGDICEDTDGDSIINGKDNCVYEYNIDQKDVDGDKIGDVCDKKDNRFIESNKYFFIGLLLFIILIFSFGIFYMIKKIKK